MNEDEYTGYDIHPAGQTGEDHKCQYPQKISEHASPVMNLRPESRS